MEDFTDLVQKWFAYLVEENGFTCKVQGERMVIYSNSVAVIRVGHGNRGGVGITADQSSTSNFYPFEFFLSIFFPDEAARLSEFEGTSRFEVEMAVIKLENLLKSFGAPLVDGDPEVFRRMAAEVSSPFSS